GRWPRVLAQPLDPSSSESATSGDGTPARLPATWWPPPMTVVPAGHVALTVPTLFGETATKKLTTFVTLVQPIWSVGLACGLIPSATFVTSPARDSLLIERGDVVCGLSEQANNTKAVDKSKSLRICASGNDLVADLVSGSPIGRATQMVRGATSRK